MYVCLAFCHALFRILINFRFEAPLQQFCRLLRPLNKKVGKQVAKLILNTECNLYAFQSKAVYSSRQVAEEFSKRTADVLRAIDELTERKIALSGTDLKNQVSEELMKMLAGQTIEQFCAENFFESKYKDASGKWNREVLMTMKGSMFIIMGFTGRKATVLKIGLLNRFEAMEDFILSLNTARLEHPAFTDAIHSWAESRGKEAKAHYFINEADMINRIVLGMSAKQYREERGIPKGESIRPHLTNQQVGAIELLQRADIGLLMALPEFEDRKEALKRYFERMKLNSKLIA